MKEENKCAILIKQIHSELEKNANNALRRDDLTMSQITVLMELNRADGKQMELKRLEHLLHVAQSTAAGIVRRLEEKGFVEAFGNPEDKRVKMIRITAVGQECCRKAETNMQNTGKQMMSSLTETEQSILISLLQKVRNSF